MKQLTALAATAALMVGVAASGAAQARGIPVYNSGVSTGLAVAGEFGVPNGASGGGTAYGASARVGFGPLGLAGMAVRNDPKGSGNNFTSLGAAANIKVFGGPLIPLSVTLQGGAGYSRTDFVAQPTGTTAQQTEWRVPVGLGIAISLPNPVLAIRPWIAPRVDIVRLTRPTATTSDANFAISGGVEFNLLSGIGLHTAYDWSRRNGVTYGTFGVGLHYAL